MNDELAVRVGVVAVAAATTDWLWPICLAGAGSGGDLWWLVGEWLVKWRFEETDVVGWAENGSVDRKQEIYCYKTHPQLVTDDVRHHWHPEAWQGERGHVPLRCESAQMGGSRSCAKEKSGNFIKFKVANGNVKLLANGYVQNECTRGPALLILHLPNKKTHQQQHHHHILLQLLIPVLV